MSEDQAPQLSAEEQRRAVLRDFLTKHKPEVVIHNAPPAQEKVKINPEPQAAPPSRIVQANADGSLKPEPEPTHDTINFRAYPDGTFCKFTEIKDRPGFLAICLNTSPAGEPDVLQQVGIVKSRAVADMLCDGVNLMMQLKISQQQLAEQEQQAADVARLDSESPTINPS